MKIKFPNRWNVIPIEKNSKRPLIKWKDYQNKLFPREQLPYYMPCNFAVICGTVSNKLVIIDYDFKDKPLFENIIKDLKIHFPEASDTLVVTTPHGLHIYFYINGNVPSRKTQLKSPFKEIKAIDILGEGGYALIPPSQIGQDTFYMNVMGKKPATITEELFNKIINFYTLKEEDKFIPKRNIEYKLTRLRKPFQDILKGTINIEKLSKETNTQEFIYWKYTFLEGMNSGVITKPQDFYPLLRANQPAFDIEQCELQIPHHVKPSMRPLTNKKLRLYFPDYNIEDPLQDWLIIAKELIEEYDIITMEDSKQIMIRRGNIYSIESKEFYETLNKKLEDMTFGKAYRTKRENILTYIKDMTIFSRDKFCYDDWVINFPNGYFNIKRNRFIPHEENKDRVFFYEIPHEYKKGDTKCDKYRKLLKEWLGENHILNEDDIFEMIGYSMTMNTDMKLAFFIYGGKHSGKSSFQNILGYLIGNKNLASTELQRLGQDQFGTDDLQFKIVNMIGDMSDTLVQDLSKFKLLTGGDEYVPAEVKGGRKYRFRNTIKIWYNGNYIPKIKNEYDDAFFARWILIEFPSYFPVYTNDSIKSIWNMINEDDDEIQGIIHRAIEGARRLYKRGYFRYELIKNTEHIWKYQSDDVYAFIYDNCIRGEDECLEVGEFTDSFNRYLYKRHKKPLSSFKIKELLEEHGIFKLREGSGTREYYYNGIGWKPDPPEPKYKKFEKS